MKRLHNSILRFQVICMILVSSFTSRKSLFSVRQKCFSNFILGATKTTGSFKRNLPEVYAAETHFKRALRSLNRIHIDSTIKNQRNQNRKYAAQSLDALMKGLTVPITKVLDSYKDTYRTLHPFEATVAELTIVSRTKVGHPHLQDIFTNLKQLRAKTSRLAKDYASRANNATSAIEAKDLLKEGISALETMYMNEAESLYLTELVDIQKDLKRIPVVELNTPTIVLVGAPNVGKSSIVRAVSSGTPEVNDYPFTTRGVSIGHILNPSRGIRFQVMDTPGLLDRPADERNEMEKLTFASLAHLPTAVMFVIDPTGLSGEKSTLLAQLNVRKALRERFPRRPWIDVVSKADMIIPPEVLALLPENFLHVSVVENINVEILKLKIEDMLLNLQDALQVFQNDSNNEEEMGGEEKTMQSPVSDVEVDVEVEVEAEDNVKEQL